MKRLWHGKERGQKLSDVIYGWTHNLIFPFLLHQVLHDGIPKYQSPPDMSLITCLAMTNDCNVIAYGCYNGSVRLYYLDSSAVKTLGSHQEKVIDLAVNIEIMPDTQMEMVVVVSGKLNIRLAHIYSFSSFSSKFKIKTNILKS